MVILLSDCVPAEQFECLLGALSASDSSSPTKYTLMITVCVNEFEPQSEAHLNTGRPNKSIIIVWGVCVCAPFFFLVHLTMLEETTSTCPHVRFSQPTIHIQAHTHRHRDERQFSPLQPVVDNLLFITPDSLSCQKISSSISIRPPLPLSLSSCLTLHDQVYALS